MRHLTLEVQHTLAFACAGVYQIAPSSCRDRRHNRARYAHESTTSGRRVWSIDVGAELRGEACLYWAMAILAGEFVVFQARQAPSVSCITPPIAKCAL